jgi:hypothetical protein
LLIEGLVPDLLDMVWVYPAAADAGIRAVEKKEARQPQGSQPRDLLGHVCSDVMGDETKSIET